MARMDSIYRQQQRERTLQDYTDPNIPFRARPRQHQPKRKAPTHPSRLEALRSDYQKKLLLEKELKMVQIFEHMQEQAEHAIRKVSGNSNKARGGVVRGFFQERKTASFSNEPAAPAAKEPKGRKQHIEQKQQKKSHQTNLHSQQQQLAWQREKAAVQARKQKHQEYQRRNSGRGRGVDRAHPLQPLDHRPKVRTEPNSVASPGEGEYASDFVPTPPVSRKPQLVRQRPVKNAYTSDSSFVASDEEAAASRRSNNRKSEKPSDFQQWQTQQDAEREARLQQHQAKKRQPAPPPKNSAAHPTKQLAKKNQEEYTRLSFEVEQRQEELELEIRLKEDRLKRLLQEQDEDEREEDLELIEERKRQAEEEERRRRLTKKEEEKKRRQEEKLRREEEAEEKQAQQKLEEEKRRREQQRRKTAAVAAKEQREKTWESYLNDDDLDKNETFTVKSKTAAAAAARQTSYEDNRFDTPVDYPDEEAPPVYVKPQRKGSRAKVRASQSKVRESPPLAASEDNNRLYREATDPGGEVDPNLVPCPHCGRKFAKDRLEKHYSICVKQGQKKRKVYDPSKIRTQGTEMEQYQTGKKSKPERKPAKKSDWRQKHESFIQSIREARQFQNHINQGGKASDLPPPKPSENLDYVQCPHCQRRFNPSVAERHIPKCKNIKSRPAPLAPKKHNRKY